MLTKNCKIILRYVTSLPGPDQLSSIKLSDLVHWTKFSYKEVVSACKELDKDGLAELKILHLINGQELPESITLTESGLNYKVLIRTQRIKYIADKWTDIIACIIALISLIISIHTALSN